MCTEYLTPASTTSRPTTHNYYNTDTNDGNYLNVGRNRGPEAPLLPPPPSRPTVAPALPTASAVENPEYFNTSSMPTAPRAPSQTGTSAARVPSTTTSSPKQQQNALAAANAYYMDRNDSERDTSRGNGGTELQPLLNGGSSSSTGRRVGSREASPKPANNTVVRAPLAGADGETAI